MYWIEKFMDCLKDSEDNAPYSVLLIKEGGVITRERFLVFWRERIQEGMLLLQEEGGVPMNVVQPNKGKGKKQEV